MAQKLLIPVIPSDRFYDAVVAAADIVASEGGSITFLFTQTRPPPFWEEKENLGFDTELEEDVETQGERDEVHDAWQQQMIDGMGEASELLLERGIGEEQVSYQFADSDLPAAEAIAGEAAAGAYDTVVLSRGTFINIPEGIENPGGAPAIEIASAVQELADDGVRLLVT